MNQRLTLTDLATLLAQRENIDLQQAEDFVRAFFELTEEGLVRDNFVKVTGFGTTKLVEVSERESININTGERINIGSHSKVSFTPDNKLRDLINRPFDHFTTVTLYEATTEEELEAVSVEDLTAEEETPLTAPTATDTPAETLEINEVDKTLPPLVENIIPTLHNEEVVAHHKDVVVTSKETTAPNEEVALSIEETDAPNQETTAPNEEVAPSIEETDAPHQEATPFCEEAALEIPKVEEQDMVELNAKAESHCADSLPPPKVEEPHSPPNATASPTIESDHPSLATAVLDLEASPSTSPSSITNIQGSILVKTEENTTVSKLNFWKNAFFVTLALLLCVLCYFLGYHQGFRSNKFVPVVTPSVLPTKPTDSNAPATTAPSAAEAVPSSQKSEATSVPKAQTSKEAAQSPQTTTASALSMQTKDAQTNQKASTPPASTTTSPQRPAPQPNYAAEANKHQQLPKGHALIVGTLRTHTLRAGDNIYRLARETYGSNDFAPYIILYNGILDPDVVPLNQNIKLPKLVHKETMQPIGK